MSTTTEEACALTNWDLLEQIAELRWTDKVKASERWQTFLGSNPTDDELFSVVRGIRLNGTFVIEAAATLLKRAVVKSEHLVQIITNVLEQRDEAWKRLKEQKPSCVILRKLTRHVPDVMEEAWEQLKALNPATSHLLYVMKNVPTLRDEAARLLLNKDCTNKDLRMCMRYSAVHQTEAWKRLLTQSPDVTDFRYVFTHVESLRWTACIQLLEKDLNPTDLAAMVKHAVAAEADTDLKPVIKGIAQRLSAKETPEKPHE